MKRRIFLMIAVCMLLSIGIITALKINSKDPYKKINGFNRVLSSQVLSNFMYIDLQYNSYYIAGLSSEKIFLANSTASSHILHTDYTLKDTAHVYLKNPNNYKIAWKLANVYIDFPNIYLYEELSPQVLHGKFPSLQLTETYNLDNIWFDQLVPITSKEFALRKYDESLQQNILLIKKKGELQPITAQNLILKKQVDGIFCTDGMLLYSSEMERLIYLYYYRNQFISMDTNMDVIYTARTIDTISMANIKLATISSENRTTFSSPPLRVNKKSCLFQNNFFVYSQLIADNEEPKLFKQNSVIDIYNLKNGNYISSFYVPDFKNNKIRHFQVFDKKLVVIYDHYLATFDFNLY